MHRRILLTSLAGLAIVGPAGAQMKHDMNRMRGCTQPI